MKAQYYIQVALSITAALISTASSDLKAASSPVVLASGLEGSAGSTIGPGGDLYVTEGAAGRISRIDLQTGTVTTYASGLPKALFGFGGPVDVAFVGSTAYALVTLVGPDVGGTAPVGIYRIDGPDSATLVANVGAYSIQHPPLPSFFIPSGVQYALESYRGGFLVTDGHHNRVLQVTPSGEIGELLAFGNIVPTGLAIHGDDIFMAEAGPVPHLPAEGKVVAFDARQRAPVEIASGASLIVDVEFGRGQRLYALSQGRFSGAPEGSPALPNTGSLLQVNDDGTFTPLVEELDRPTSLEIVGNTAYVITLTGNVLQITDLAAPPFGGH